MHAADAVVLRLLRDRIGDPIVLHRFGSSVAGGLRAESDIDYAVLATRGGRALRASGGRAQDDRAVGAVLA